ncbi:MAG: hypothetical protein V1824_02325 [archaeon]
MNKENILKFTKENIKKKLNSPDQMIIQYSLIVNRLPETINHLFEELRIISDHKFPNLDTIVSLEDYCNICLLEKIDNESLAKINIKNKQAIENIINEDIGVTNTENDKIIRDFARQIIALIKLKTTIDLKMEDLFKENYINFYNLAGLKIASKMFEISGSIERLSKFPASTIQLLGAEKSFFKALKTNRKTPKYGIIYNHALIINLKAKDKAKIARVIAGKISIAIKADLSKKQIYKELLEKINKRIKSL